MEDLEVIITEPDEVQGEEGATIEGLHPPTLEPQTPRLIADVMSACVTVVCAYGWYVLGFLILGYITWSWWKPSIKKWLQKREKEQEVAAHLKNPDVFLARERAIDEARRRMQEQYNDSIKKNLEKGKLENEKKEEKKQENTGEFALGSQPKANLPGTSGGRSSASASSSSLNTSKGKSATKAKLRPEYNPLMGDTGAGDRCRWRPSTQGRSGGG